MYSQTQSPTDAKISTLTLQDFISDSDRRAILRKCVDEICSVAVNDYAKHLKLAGKESTASALFRQLAWRLCYAELRYKLLALVPRNDPESVTAWHRRWQDVGEENRQLLRRVQDLEKDQQNKESTIDYLKDEVGKYKKANTTYDNGLKASQDQLAEVETEWAEAAKVWKRDRSAYEDKIETLERDNNLLKREFEAWKRKTRTDAVAVGNTGTKGVEHTTTGSIESTTTKQIFRTG